MYRSGVALPRPAGRCAAILDPHAQAVHHSGDPWPEGHDRRGASPVYHPLRGAAGDWSGEVGSMRQALNSLATTAETMATAELTWVVEELAAWAAEEWEWVVEELGRR